MVAFGGSDRLGAPCDADGARVDGVQIRKPERFFAYLLKKFLDFTLELFVKNKDCHHVCLGIFIIREDLRMLEEEIFERPVLGIAQSNHQLLGNGKKSLKVNSKGMRLTVL